MQAQSIAKEFHVVTQLLNTFRMRINELQIAECSRRYRRGHRCRENETARLVFQEFNQLLGTGDKAAFGGHGLAQSPDGHIGMFTIVMFRKSAPRAPKDARGMRLINHEQHAMRFRNPQKLRQVCQIAIHAENGIRHNKTTEIRNRVFRKLFSCAELSLGRSNRAFQIRHVIVLVHKAFCTRKANAINDACVIQFVAENKIVLATQRRNRSHVRHVARIERDSRLFAFELCNKLFEFIVRSLVAGREASATAPRSPFKDRIRHRLLEFRNVRQIQVRIRSEQNRILTRNRHMRCFWRRDVTQRAVRIVRTRRFKRIFREKV